MHLPEAFQKAVLFGARKDFRHLLADHLRAGDVADLFAAAVEVGEDKKETITFGLTMLLKAGNDVTINKDDANSMIENEANGDQTDDTSSTESTAQ